VSGLLPFVGVLALAALPQAGVGPRAPQGRAGDEVAKMVDAYIVSNLQESLGLTDEEFVKLLPLVKRLQSERRTSMQGRRAAVRELRRLLESGTATEAQVAEQLHQVKREEIEGPEKVRRTTEGIDAALTPLQQAKFRVLESDVEKRIREIINQARRQGLPAGRGNKAPTPDEP
jgi:Spy/CpxP family protein refolding chaperone